MELMQAVNSRRSIRKFAEGVNITVDEIKEMVACAQLAPSWKNSQTARYYAVIDQGKMQEIFDKALPSFNAASAANSAALIITTFEMKRAGFDREGNADNELGDQWGAYDLGLQNENLLLKATEMGYDTLVMGIRDGVALRELLEIPDSQQVVAVISVGKRVEDALMPKRKDVDSILKVF